MLLASMIETASSAGKGGATICDRSCSRASGRRKKTRRSGIVYKRWERSGPRFRNGTCPAAQTMTSRTGGTRSSRRHMHAPGGREWEAAENEMRALFLGSASRTQSRKNLGGNDRRRPRASGDAKKTSKLPKPSPESPSPPAPGRKLFDSPLGVGTDGEEVCTPGPSRSQLANAVEVQLVTAEDVHDVLLQGEISAESFDVEAFLPKKLRRRDSLCTQQPDERWCTVHAVQAPRHHVVRRGPGVAVSDRLGSANVMLDSVLLESKRVPRALRT